MVKKIKKEEVKEIFEITEKGKQKIIEKKGIVEEVIIKKDQAKEENKILKNFLIGIGIIALIFLGIWLAQMNKTFEYQSLEWDIIKSGDIKFYHTSFPTSPTNIHNVYLRNDPRKLEKEVPFEGQLKVMKMIAMVNLNEFNCDGDGIISQASMEQVFNAWGISIINDPEATCDLEGRYTFIRLLQGNETKIVQTKENCYILYINDCEVIQAKERFLVEGFIVKNS